MSKLKESITIASTEIRFVVTHECGPWDTSITVDVLHGKAQREARELADQIESILAQKPFSIVAQLESVGTTELRLDRRKRRKLPTPKEP